MSEFTFLDEPSVMGDPLYLVGNIAGNFVALRLAENDFCYFYAVYCDQFDSANECVQYVGKANSEVKKRYDRARIVV